MKYTVSESTTLKISIREKLYVTKKLVQIQCIYMSYE